MSKREIPNGVRRLTILADWLAVGLRGKFNLSYWWKDNLCGSTGCAVGHGADCPVLRREGLYLALHGSGASLPAFGELREWEAVCAFFELTSTEADLLFDAMSYVRGSRYDVMHRIRRFCREKTGATLTVAG